MSTTIKRLFTLGLIFCLSFSAVYLYRLWKQNGSFFQNQEEDTQLYRTETYTLATRAPLNPEEVPSLDRYNEEMVTLVEKVTPSVVSINTEAIKKERFLNFNGQIYERTRRTPGLGSGVIVSHEGHVITNYHVIAGQQKILVTLHTGEVLPATLLNYNRLIDIAVLRIRDDRTFQPLKFGDSDKVKVGQLSIAVGNPFGLGESVTKGHISARNRSVSDGQRDFLQTDAAINPGNSGGPLVNHLGEIIGINAAIYTPDQENPGFQGIGFSIPSNDVKYTFNHIMEKGRPVYGYLGFLKTDNLNQSYRRLLNYTGEGVVLADIVEGSPAEKAGLRPYDIITHFNGEKINKASDLITRVQRSHIGKKIKLKIWRAKKTIELDATVSEFDPQNNDTPPTGTRIAQDNAILEIIGLKVQNLPARHRAAGYRGVLITEVLPGSFAHRAGLKPKDHILSINDVLVTSDVDFYTRIATTSAVQATKLKFFRNSTPFETTLPPVPRKKDTD